MLTATDLFAGAGGSSTGLTQVPGVEVKMAANHWRLAIETHNLNHPATDHDCADISQVDPRRYPRTDLLWASPECTNHSQAKGKSRAARAEGFVPDANGDVLPEDAAERSRSTMWDVVRFAEVHRYSAVIVENVVEAAQWEPFTAWLSAMHSLGYDHQLKMLNSAHAQALGGPAPQSRDRMYVIFHRRGNAAPDLSGIAPLGACACGHVGRLRQHFKNGGNWGRYRSQYVYLCAACSAVTEPFIMPARTVIDWSLPGQRIGDRARPLAAKTIARIEAGLGKFAGRPMGIPLEGRDGKVAFDMDGLLRTASTRRETGLAWDPFIVELRGGGSKFRSIDEPLATVTASGNHHGLVMPADVGGFVSTSLVATAPDVQDCRFRMLEPHEVAAGMAFPTDYTILGNKREQVRQAGNAVTPPAARDLVAAVAVSLGHDLEVAA